MNISASAFSLLIQSLTNEHYTPPWVFDLVRQLGPIALDPSSNPIAQQWIQADQCFMLPVDGLQRDWTADGGLWLNPPYGTRSKSSLLKNSAFLKWCLLERERVDVETWAIALTLLSIPNYGASAWIKRAIAFYESGRFPWAVLLVRGDGGGVKELESRYSSCEPDQRIAFVDAAGKVRGNPPPGCRFWYLGDDPQKFAEVFSGVGAVRVPYTSAAKNLTEQRLRVDPRTINDAAEDLHTRLANLEKRKAELIADGLPPEKATIETGKVSGRRFRQAYWRSREEIFVKGDGQPCKRQYIGAEGSPAYREAKKRQSNGKEYKAVLREIGSIENQIRMLDDA